MGAAARLSAGSQETSSARRHGGTRPGAILLPAPTLGAQNVVRAADALGIAARRRQISHKQANDEARAEIRDWLEMTSRSASEFDRVLGFEHRD